MFDKNKVKLGIAPIAWTNDDMPDLGKENTFEQCVSEMAVSYTHLDVYKRQGQCLHLHFCFSASSNVRKRFRSKQERKMRSFRFRQC